MLDVLISILVILAGGLTICYRAKLARSPGLFLFRRQKKHVAGSEVALFVIGLALIMIGVVSIIR